MTDQRDWQQALTAAYLENDYLRERVAYLTAANEELAGEVAGYRHRASEVRRVFEKFATAAEEFN